jgi:hypothetical protein
VEEGTRRRVFLRDARNGDRYLRVTWHPESSTLVWSHWQGDVCVASTPVRVEDAAQLVGLLSCVLKEPAA